MLYAELGKAKAAAADAKNYAPLPDLARQQTPYRINSDVPLADSQATMQTAILGGSAIDTKPDQWIRAKEQFAPADQLAVYINGYRYRLYDITAEDYPVLKHYLGDDEFSRLIDAFIEHTPSSHFNVNRYASHMPAFVAVHLAEDTFAYELAVLETAVSQLTDPEETTPLEPSHLAGITPETLMETVLHPREALQLLAFEYQANEYFNAVKNEESPAPVEKKSYLAVFRHEDVVWRMPLGENEYRLLKQLFAGMPIGKALEAMQAELGLPEEELSAELMNWFSRWMRNGLLAYRTPTNHALEREVA
ncbi:MAG: DNA-binding domain-containing protein [Rickettsiales bacterium]